MSSNVLASQILQMIDGFLNDDSNWLIFTTAMTMENFIVTEGGQVFLNDLNLVQFNLKYEHDYFLLLKFHKHYQCGSSFFLRQFCA